MAATWPSGHRIKGRTVARTTREIDRLLIVRNDGLGDLVLTLPAMNYARKVFPQARITALVSDRYAPLLHASQDVDEVLVDDRRDSAWALSRRLRAGRFDAVAVVNTNSRNCLAVWLAGIPLRATWGCKPMSCLVGNRRIWLRRSHPPVHESDFALAFLKRLKHDPSVRAQAPSLIIPGHTRDSIRARLSEDLGLDRPWFGVHPGSHNSAYNWPPDRYRELIERLTEYGSVAMTGGSHEGPLLAGIRDGLSARSRAHVAFYQHLSLLELAAIIASVNVLTVSSTGPMHLAGLCDTPLVALFSSRLILSPQKWAPLGRRRTILEATWRGNHTGHEAREHMCQISVESVLEANLRYLEEAKVAS